MKHEDTFDWIGSQKRKRRGQPWERHMSLCIAAVAKESGADRLVICMDKQVSTDTAKAETEFKGRYIATDLVVLFAGVISDAHELIDIYLRHLRQHPFDWQGDDPLMPLRTPLEIYRQRQIETFVQARLGISYERFLKDGKKELDPETHRGLLFDISRMTVDVHLIIAGFIDGERAKIFTFEGAGISQQSHFACIGTGAVAAQHSLFRRRQDSDTSVEKSLYNVWEAKKFGELSPTVGREGVAMVLEPGALADMSHFRLVDESGRAVLDKLYSLYGPNELPSVLPSPLAMRG